MTVALGGMPELAIVVGQRNVFYKHRDSAFFPTSSFVVAQSVVGIPINVMQSIFFGTIMWWMCGLTDSDNGGKYGLFILVSFVLSVSVNQVMFDLIL